MPHRHAFRLLAPCVALALSHLACGSAPDATSTTGSHDAGLKLTSELPVDGGGGHDAKVDSTPYTPSAPIVQPSEPKAHGPYPIVLMHGMGGFNSLDNLPLTISYFNGVQADLESHGYGEIFVTVAPPYATSEARAASLAPQLDSILKMTGAEKLNLIGHSQGGLDARLLVSPGGMNYGSKVASVTTVATPHQGTKVADLAMGLITGPAGTSVSGIANDLLNLLEQGVYSVQSAPDIQGQLTELTTSYMTDTFNPKYVDAKGVVYASYAGRTNLESGTGDCDDAVYANQPTSLDIPQPELQPTASFLQLEGETSDGLVAVTSAKWGTFMECVPADHLKECGMIDQNGADPVSGYDHLVFFRAVAARLRAQGF